MRSEVTSRSNWAKDRSTFRVRTHGRRRVELLGDRDKGDVMGIEQFDQFCEVGQRSGQPIDLIDHDDVDLSGSNIVQQPL
jgi:hypothetical protein